MKAVAIELEDFDLGKTATMLIGLFAKISLFRPPANSSWTMKGP
jgi:hypothetical protein